MRNPEFQELPAWENRSVYAATAILWRRDSANVVGCGRNFFCCHEHRCRTAAGNVAARGLLALHGRSGAA